ncbi:GtrA family protein [Paenibacillus xylaniclasticus]|uniref:GtrA family protein n=1 Tax=Paenibacillus xylaniclasticus TaxID=588083 RepID=UPI000FD93C5F|nr:sugar translocase [Paenibacillus curdlanolyticus]
MIKKLLSHDFVRFIMVGVMNTLVGLGSIYLFINLFHMGYWLSTFAGNTVGSINSFYWNKSFTFKANGSANQGMQMLRFLLVTLVCYGLSYFIGYLATDVFISSSQSNSVLYNIAALVGTFIYTISNYFGHKYFTFRQ